MDRHFYIILNRHAGRGQSSKAWDIVERELTEKSESFTVVTTRYPGHATLLAEQFATHQEFIDTVQEIVLVVGGDGTLNEALNGLAPLHLDKLLPLAYIPAGSGNDFARGAGLSQNVQTALQQVLAAHEPKSLDIGHYNETIKHEQHYFVNNVGIGFDAAIVSAANHSNQKGLLNRLKMGSLAYVGQVTHILSYQDAFPVTVQIDDHRQVFPNGFLLTTSNHPYFGGGVPILPIASVTDHKLSLILVEKLPLPLFLLIASQVPSGRHLRSKRVHHYQAEQIHLTVPVLEHGQVDGEEMGTRSFDIYLTTTQYPFWFTEA